MCRFIPTCTCQASRDPESSGVRPCPPSPCPTLSNSWGSARSSRCCYLEAVRTSSPASSPTCRACGLRPTSSRTSRDYSADSGCPVRSSTGWFWGRRVRWGWCACWGAAWNVGYWTSRSWIASPVNETLRLTRAVRGVCNVRIWSSGSSRASLSCWG